MVDLTIVVLNLNNQLNVSEFTKFINKHFNYAQVIIASEQKHNITSENITEYIFKNETDDSVINALVKTLNTNKLILIRAIDDNFDSILKLHQNLKKSNEICLFVKKRNKIVEFFDKIFDKITKFIFGYKFFNGNIAQMAFGKIVIDVLKQVDNASMFTKMDKWSGVVIKELETEQNIPKVKFKANKLTNYITIAISSCAIIALILCWALIKYIQNSFLLKILFVFIILIALSIIFFEVALVVAKLKVGVNTYKCAEINLENNQNDNNIKGE